MNPSGIAIDRSPMLPLYPGLDRSDGITNQTATKKVCSIHAVIPDEAIEV